MYAQNSIESLFDMEPSETERETDAEINVQNDEDKSLDSLPQNTQIQSSEENLSAKKNTFI